jgi:TolA-binding protein
MSRIARLLSVSMLSGCILIFAGYAAGQQSAISQSKPVPMPKSRTAQSAPAPSDKVTVQLAQVQEQLKQLQDAIDAMRSEQQLMKVSLESTERVAAQSSLDLGEITHILGQDGKTIDGLGRQVEIVGRQVDLAGRQVDLVARGVGILLERTDTLPSDLRQIKNKLGLY